MPKADPFLVLLPRRQERLEGTLKRSRCQPGGRLLAGLGLERSSPAILDGSLAQLPQWVQSGPLEVAK